jgi:glycosyltransferase involved in cell wall biosynthesis
MLRRGPPEEGAASLSGEPSAPPKPRILHITADYPDLNKPVNTLAIKNFIDANQDAEHFIISLNRTSVPWRYRVTEGGGHGDPRVVSIRYLGFPLGAQLAASMYAVAWKTHNIVKERNLRFDVIHAHKLAFEGLAGYWLSLWTNIPLVCSIRGEVEQKVFRFKPYYRPLYRAVVRHCSHLYYVSAWFRPYMSRFVEVDPAKERLLPNFIPFDRLRPQKDFRPDAFLSILSFQAYKRKGLHNLLLAFRQFLGRAPRATLDLVGRGTPQRLAHIQHLIDRAGLSANVRLIGPVEPTELLRRLPGYAAMVLPSRNETFGMAYLEALLSAVPVLYSRGTGVDGYMEGIKGAVGTDPKSIDAISDGLYDLYQNQHVYREWLLENTAIVRSRFDATTWVLAYNQDIAMLKSRRAAGEAARAKRALFISNSSSVATQQD